MLLEGGNEPLSVYEERSYWQSTLHKNRLIRTLQKKTELEKKRKKSKFFFQVCMWVGHLMQSYLKIKTSNQSYFL